jgi:hypothetical protein
MKKIIQVYKTLPGLIRYSAWVAACCAAAFLFQLLGLPELHIGSLFALALGIFLFTDSPLQKRGANYALESGIGATLIISFIIHFGFVVIVPVIEAEDTVSMPCNDQTLSMRCYSLARENCQMAWQRFEKDCKNESLSIRQDRPTSLLGPIVKKCTFRKMDQAFRSTRKTAVDIDCKGLFADLDAPVF